MRPMCAGDTLSRCRKDIFAEPSSDMLLLPWHDTISDAGYAEIIVVANMVENLTSTRWKYLQNANYDYSLFRFASETGQGKKLSRAFQ